MTAVPDSFDKDLSYDAILELCAHISQPVVTTREVREAFDISQQAAHYRLTELEDRGDLQRKKIGANGNVWWLTEQGRQKVNVEVQPSAHGRPA